MRRAIVVLLTVSAAACTVSEPSGTFREIAVDTGAPAMPAALLGGGWEFGFCAGYCSSEVVIRTDGRVLLEITDRRHAQRTIRNRGVLAPSALAEAESIVADLGETTLEEVYGCPDCTDGGAGFIRTWGEDPARSTYDFQSPPADLARADRFVGEVIAALETCESTDVVTVGSGCTPRPTL